VFAYLIPLYIALVAIGCLTLANALGLTLQWSARFAPLGRAILWYSCLSLGMAIVFTFAATWPLMVLLSLFLDDWGGVIGLWAGGPLGLLLGLGLAFRHRSRQAMFANSAWRWTIGGVTLLVLIGAVWLALQTPDGSEPKTPARDVKSLKSPSHHP
jgi:hypothetical protein